MILPAQSCTDHACLERRRYDKWISDTAEDIQANGNLVQPTVKKTMLRRRDRGTMGLHSIDMGSGKVVGNFVRDQVCVHGDGDESLDDRCFPLAMLVANQMSDMPFVLEPYDGAIGLGLKGMSVSPEFNFLASFYRGYGGPYTSATASVFSNSFGLHIGNDQDGGEITLGGYDANRLTQPLQWAPVADPEEGRWQVAISAIRVGNNTLEACRNKASEQLLTTRHLCWVCQKILQAAWKLLWQSLPLLRALVTDASTWLFLTSTWIWKVVSLSHSRPRIL